MRHIIFNGELVDQIALSEAMAELKAGEFLLLDMRLYGAGDHLIQMVNPLVAELERAHITHPNHPDIDYWDDLRLELARLFLGGGEELNEYLINGDLFSFKIIDIEDRNQRGLFIGLIDIMERFGLDKLRSRLELLPQSAWAIQLRETAEIMWGGVE